jgi:H+-transporting ATPase
VLGTQIIATFIAVYGFLMTPLGWGWAGFVWVYAILWALVSDRVKLLAYRIFDPVKVSTPSDVTPQIAGRAYELYEQEGRREGHSVQDWEKAEQEIRKNKSPKQNDGI